MNSELRLDELMKSIDVYGRLAFGGQCIAAMMIFAAPTLFITASILPFMRWDENRDEAVVLWIGGWLLAVSVGAAGLLLGVVCWRWSGDWITEWPGYAVGFGIAGVANIALGLLLTSSPVPIYASFLLAMAGAFVGGVAIAGNLAGTGVLPDQRVRNRVPARRR